MNNIYRFAVGALLFSACNAASDKAVTQENSAEQASPTSDEEWISLFDGETLNGWHTYGQDKPGNAWKVEDGALFLDTSNKEDWQTTDGGDIVTDQEFEDFHLKLEWKVAENANSGIMIYVQEDTSRFDYPWNTGMEMQILHNEGHPDGKIQKHRAGDLYDLIESSEEAAKPVGEWNEVEIISVDQNLELYLNGKNVVSTTLWDNDWEELISKSKFKDMEGFGTFQKGKIALQDHGDPVWFRNIMIREL